jgi:hypothetical protein
MSMHCHKHSHPHSLTHTHTHPHTHTHQLNAELASKSSLLLAAEEQKGQLIKLIESLRESSEVHKPRATDASVIRELKARIRETEAQTQRWHELWLSQHKRVAGESAVLGEVTNTLYVVHTLRACACARV